ncbi:hypothetical protein HDV01_005505 [Terramyces sp. JEL0728]|nr:hypothetical protein HDV01_005505 [Terramyces sp. JEL0728]
MPVKFMRKERYGFLHLIYKMFVSEPIDLQTLLITDISTSFSKILAQIPIHLASFTKQDSLVSFIVCIPYLLRLKQCLGEASNVLMFKKIHLMNALKYFSALPVVILGHFVGNMVFMKDLQKNEIYYSWQIHINSG